jgi:hypothetical protein
MRRTNVDAATGAGEAQRPSMRFLPIHQAFPVVSAGLPPNR